MPKGKPRNLPRCYACSVSAAKCKGGVCAREKKQCIDCLAPNCTNRIHHHANEKMGESLSTFSLATQHPRTLPSQMNNRIDASPAPTTHTSSQTVIEHGISLDEIYNEGDSAWLSCKPLRKDNLNLSPVEFRDALAARYG
ncbi:hypothetical protein GJ496_007085 [Pomphorhynchus laevis]|nr:hypothetical protein GJ496_007085 [Pomphorhynchus laevis]